VSCPPLLLIGEDEFATSYYINRMMLDGPVKAGNTGIEGLKEQTYKVFIKTATINS
jgi:hypothetical protein